MLTKFRDRSTNRCHAAGSAATQQQEPKIEDTGADDIMGSVAAQGNPTFVAQAVPSTTAGSSLGDPVATGTPEISGPHHSFMSSLPKLPTFSSTSNAPTTSHIGEGYAGTTPLLQMSDSGVHAVPFKTTEKVRRGVNKVWPQLAEVFPKGFMDGQEAVAYVEEKGSDTQAWVSWNPRIKEVQNLLVFLLRASS
jgi:hypothetical protein